jgi:hypothetical protein
MKLLGINDLNKILQNKLHLYGVECNAFGKLQDPRFE